MIYVPKCDTCGELTHVLVDGYTIRDRVFEGVWFMVYFGNGKATHVTPLTKEDAEYLDDFNTKKIYKEVMEFANNSDILICPTCREDIDGPIIGTATIVKLAPATDITAMIQKGIDNSRSFHDHIKKMKDK